VRYASYTDTVTINTQSNPNGNMVLWPNPTNGSFFVGINGNKDIKSIVIRDMLGRKVWEEDVAGRNVIEINGFATGMYVVAAISYNDHIIEALKQVVTGL